MGDTFGDADEDAEDDDDDADDADDDADDDDEPKPAAPKAAAPKAGKASKDKVEWVDPRGPVSVRIHKHPSESGYLAYTVLPGGEGPPPGLRKSPFNKIQFAVDADGKAFLEFWSTGLPSDHKQDDPGNLVFPSSDPARFQAAQQLRDFCKEQGIDCDVGLYLNTQGFTGIPTCWKMENFANDAYDKGGRVMKCSKCDKGSHMCAFGGGKTTHTANACKDCFWGQYKDKCVVCKTNKAVHLANVSDQFKKKGCMFCGKPT